MGIIIMRIDVTSKMNISDLVYKHPETKLEKNMELYSKENLVAVVYQNGKFVNFTNTSNLKTKVLRFVFALII